MCPFVFLEKKVDYCKESLKKMSGRDFRILKKNYICPQ